MGIRAQDNPYNKNVMQNHFEKFITSRNTGLGKNQRNFCAIFYLVADGAVQLFGE
jgi:hypothetical protein